ncbi:hypothetical protein ACQ4M3_08080 [Leptolyngbya sp. AN03gr2]|uniref:hypothetical protein n=1 Tax=unclassified Leptolyngbya TaxID=2650499 RepID=UPI003D315640
MFDYSCPETKLSAEAVLQTFVETINDAGGIAYDRKGCPFPIGDSEWIDLATVYLEACEILNLIPCVNPNEDNGADDSEDNPSD